MNFKPEANELAWIERLGRAPFVASFAGGDPLIVARDTGRLVFATPAARAIFGVNDLTTLDGILFGSASAGARRLKTLAGTLTPGAPPRLELLRFFVGRAPIAVGWLCARVLDERGEVLFVAASPRRKSEAEPPPAVASAPAETAPPAPESRLRFLWSVDAEARFAPTDPALAERLGADAPGHGETVTALAVRVGLDPPGAWAEAIESHKTFSALRLAWRQADCAQARVALISGAPAFDRERRFAGFRGFGVLTGEWTALAAVAPSPVPTRRVPGDHPPLEGTSLPLEGTAPEHVLAAQVLTPPLLAEPTPAETLPAGDVANRAPEAAETPVDMRAEPVSTLPEPPASAAAAQDKPPAEPETSPPAAWPSAKSGEIVAFRPGAAQPAPLIRPGVFSVLNALSTVADAPRGGDSVTLSPQERDAFKEIARALGVRLRSPRLDTEAPPEAPRAPDEPEARPEPLPPPTEPADQPALAGDQYDLAGLLDQLPIGVLVIRGAQSLYLNGTLLDLVGYPSLEDFRARNGLSAIFLNRDPQTLTPGGEGGGTPLIAAGGEMVTVDAQVRPVSWQGSPAALIAMRRSRAAEHQEEIRALELERHQQSLLARDYSAALAAISDGLIRVDGSARILAMNDRAETLLGYDQNETAGESVLTLFAPSGQDALGAALDRVVSAQSATETLEVDLRERSGEVSPVRVDIGRFVASGESEFFVLLRDLSRLKRAERERETAREAAERASAAKTDFLARVSHEIRTPLHAILGFAEVMLEERFGPVSNERYKDYIRDIHASGRHVMSLANDLLDLAKIAAGKMELQFSAVDVNRVIRECVGMMQPQAARERIIVRLSLYDKLPQVMADERSLRQIVFNLLSNAVKYNEPGGQVIVSTALDNSGHTIVRVRDTGVGMNEAELASALEPFQRLAGTRKTEGSGLGLPLTKALVEANHADFAIKSRKEQGTLVEVAFPGMRAAQ